MRGQRLRTLFEKVLKLEVTLTCAKILKHPIYLVATSYPWSSISKTLNGRLPHEDSSDFDDFWTELIVMTWSIIWDKLRFFLIFSFVVVVVNYYHYEFKLNVNWNENESKNASGGTCEGGAKRPSVGCFTRCVFVFVFVFVSIYVSFEFIMKVMNAVSKSLCFEEFNFNRVH